MTSLSISSHSLLEVLARRCEISSLLFAIAEGSSSHLMFAMRSKTSNCQVVLIVALICGDDLNSLESFDFYLDDFGTSSFIY